MERKARFIGQIKTGDLDARTAEDLGSDELGNSAAATKAVATGDPRYLQQVQLDDDVKRLSALKRAHGDAKGRNAAERHACAREITATTEQLGRLDEALPRTAASADAPFAMTIGGAHVPRAGAGVLGGGGHRALGVQRGQALGCAEGVPGGLAAGGGGARGSTVDLR